MLIQIGKVDNVKTLTFQILKNPYYIVYKLPTIIIMEIPQIRIQHQNKNIFLMINLILNYYIALCLCIICKILKVLLKLFNY